MSTATKTPQTQGGSALLPPPPSGGGILRKDSSFSKPKANAARNQGAAAPTATPAGQTASGPKQGATPQAPVAANTRAPNATPANVGPKPVTPQTKSAVPAPQPQPQAPKPVTPQAAAAKPVTPQSKAMTPQANGMAPPPGMWGPNNQFAPNGASNNGPAVSPAMGAGKAAPPQPHGGAPMNGAAAPTPAMGGKPAAATPAMGPKGGAAAAPPAEPMQRQGSFTQGGNPNPYGSMGPGGYGSMNQQGFGSMGNMNGAGANGYGGVNPYGSMNQQGFGSMGNMNAMGGYGSMNQMGQPNPYGSMNQMGGMGGMGSMYGMSGNNSMNNMNMGSMYSNGGMGMGMGSMYGGSMYRPVGSIYGMGGMGQTSAYNFAAQWGSLANMSQRGSMMNFGEDGRRSSISGAGGFAENGKISIDDLCPNIGSYDDGRTIKRSGKRGGNRFYNRDKNAPVVTTANSQSNTITIKRKKDTSESPAAATRSLPTPKTADGKPRAKVPSNYDVHTLLVVEQDKGEFVKVTSPNAVVYEKAGKKETFECDEALERSTPTEELDSVLLSELRGNWFNGHNSSLLIAAGKGKTESSIEVARNFIHKCVERLEKNEKDASTKFDISINMAALKGADNGKDLLGSDDYKKLKLGSSPVFGPCLLDLTTKVAKSTDECMKIFNDGVKAATEKKDPICAFLVLKQVKKGGSESEVYLSSLCVALFREEVAAIVDLKDKTSSSPHRLFRYALGGPSVCVSAICVSNSDEKARDGLEAERKVREIKNRPPRSGNIKRFIEFTEKEISRQKEKLSSVSDSEKKQREAQINRMDEMIKEAQAMLDDPMNSTPKGYSVGA